MMRRFALALLLLVPLGGYATGLSGTSVTTKAGGGGITQAAADLLYLQLAGGSLTGAVTVQGQLVATANPADGTNTSASVLVNPTAAGAGEPLMMVGVAGTSGLLVDAEGDGTILGAQTVTGLASSTGRFRLTTTLSGAPAQPVACDVNAEAEVIVVDDLNDVTAAFGCFCGKGADDATYSWQKASAPGTACF